MSENNVIRLPPATTTQPLPDCRDRPAVSDQEKQTVIDAMSIYTDTGEAMWVSHERCPQLHFTDGRIFIFGPHGVTRLT
ncbi:hypothetical protein AN237_25300 (plasmid) [Raoultella ornithinolytica]|uniref:hypothetical protein n=1 Tax=Raoultella ornithinolytica TaxID=54291 RepID=UPI00084A1577|nr:hypothetical protein [Raoultella ornithinolytica]AOO59873.1 hypothetical protein AN237_25300 [Raoultella ornithinolytica]